MPKVILPQVFFQTHSSAADNRHGQVLLLLQAHPEQERKKCPGESAFPFEVSSHAKE